MTTSTDGQICFGILFGEDFQFPWDNEKWDGDIDEWWIYEICGYRNPFELFNASGEYIGGATPSQEILSKYYDPRDEFAKAHPVPVSIINYCSGDFPMYMVAIALTYTHNGRGEPISFDPRTLVVSDEEKQALIDFCVKHCQPISEYEEFPEMKPEWYLSSFWG